MSLDRLIIQNFRNINHADLSFSSNLNLFIGKNGSGKTSLLEAIYTLGHGRAFRTALTQRVIQNEAEKFTLFGSVQQGYQPIVALDTEQSAETTEFNEDKNTLNCNTSLLASSKRNITKVNIGLQKDRAGNAKVKIDGNEGKKIADLAQCLPIQLITPEGFSLIDGGPKYRRAYLDWGAFHFFSPFFHQWHKCKRLLKQRNAALRQVRNYKELEIWDNELSPIATELSEMRQLYSGKLISYLNTLSQQFLPQFALSFQFYPGWNQNYELAALLVKQFERDRLLGYSTLGPQKADFRITVEGHAAENVLSRGQLKLLMCALKLAQGALFSESTSRACTYLIDDFSSELDESRKVLLADCLQKQSAQLFITALESSSVDLFRKGHSDQRIFTVTEGKFDLSS